MLVPPLSKRAKNAQREQNDRATGSLSMQELVQVLIGALRREGGRPVFLEEHTPQSALPDPAGHIARVRRILRIDEVIAKTGLGRTTIFDYGNPKSPRFDPTFPQRIPLGKRAVGWCEWELETWMAHRASLVRRIMP